MLKKVTMVALPQTSLANVRGLGSGGSSRQFRLGSPCDGTFGVGNITSMVEDTDRHAIVITKGAPFAGPLQGDGKREVFDEICIPTANTAYWTVAYDKQEDPPAAKPVQGQQQNNQQRR